MEDGALSLHFTLRDGEKADLEVVAAAAIAWVGALRAAAQNIDPNAKIRIEIVDAEEGSLRLNTLLEWAENQLARLDRGSEKYPRLQKLAIALAAFLATVGVDTVRDVYLASETLSLSDEDRRRLDELLELAKKGAAVQEKSRKFFRVLERDPSISGVGVAEGRETPPAVTIPSDQFAERSGLWVAEVEPEERTTTTELDVTLVSPVLVNAPRAWVFQMAGLPPFKAIVTDRRFLSALEENHVREQLRTGITMRIRLEFTERREDDGWVMKPKGRVVTEVLLPKVD